MRILYSHRIQSRDGQGVHLEALVTALRALGHEVLVVGPSSFDRAELGGDSRLVGTLRRFLPGWTTEAAELAYNVPAYLRLARAARRFRPDVLYERANLFYVPGALLARRLGLPYLLEVNSPLTDERGRFGGLRLHRLARASERFIWRRADRVLPVTQVLADLVAAEGVRPDRISVIPNGIEPEQFASAAGPPHAGESAVAADAAVVLGFVGFVRDWHGLDHIVRALAAWQGPPRLRLQVVGDGPARSGLERLAAELGVADRVGFSGVAERDAVPRLVAGFDIALQPAAVAYASPLKIFEYMAAGRAIVAPDQPNIREILVHRRNALLFDPSEPGGLWRAVEELAADPALRAALGAAARAEIERRDLTWSGNARRVSELFEAELARRDRRGTAAAAAMGGSGGALRQADASE